MFPARSYALTAQNKTLNIANILKSAMTGLCFFHRRLEIIEQSPVVGFQSLECQTLGTSQSKLASVRGLAGVCKKCLCKTWITDIMHSIMEASPKIGVSHLLIDEDIADDTHVPRLCL